MSFSLPETPDQPEQLDDPSNGQDNSGQQDQSSGSNPVDQASDLKDKFDTGKSLKDKLAGGGGQGGAEGAGEGAVGAGATTEGAGAGAASGATGAAVGEGAAGAATGVAGGAAAGTGATSAAGTAAAGTAAAGGTAAGAGFSATGVGVVAGAPIVASSLASSKTGRKILLGCIIGCFGLIIMPLGLIILVLFTVFIPIFGGGGAGGIGTDGGNSTNLAITKTASVTKFPRGASAANITYTITVKNNTLKTASNITVTDTFSSSPEASFANQVSGKLPSYTITTLAAGASDTKTYTVTIPAELMNYDPGWILTNTATSSGSIEGSQAIENSNAGSSVVIGEPPSGPPTFSPLHNPFISGFVFGQQGVGSNGPYTHQGVDLYDSQGDKTLLSPFAQPATVVLNDPEFGGNVNGFGNYVILQSGEWQVLLAHLETPSSLSQGTTIDSNTVIGTMGNSGFVIGSNGGDGTHLHYEIRQNGGLVNPVNYGALTPHP